MDCFTVSLFGHRDIKNLFDLQKKLAPIIKELLQTKEYVAFLIGRNGEFDEFGASVIKELKKDFGKENSELNLILPYTVADLEYYDKYYDNIIIPETVNGRHYKSAITLRNRWMVEQSDLVIVYIECDSGGAHTAMNYAEKLNKKIINVFALN